MKTYTINDLQYYSRNEIEDTYPSLKRTNMTNSNFIKRHNIPKNKYISAA